MKRLFPIEQRIRQIQDCTQHLPRVEVDHFSGLTVEYAKKRNAEVILRGLRVLSDFEKELQMAHTNQTLSESIETVFLATSNEYSFLSSSVVKEIARFGGSVEHLIPESVALDLYKWYNKTPTANPNQPQTNTNLPQNNSLSNKNSNNWKNLL